DRNAVRLARALHAHVAVDDVGEHRLDRPSERIAVAAAAGRQRHHPLAWLDDDLADDLGELARRAVSGDAARAVARGGAAGLHALRQVVHAVHRVVHLGRVVQWPIDADPAGRTALAAGALGVGTDPHLVHDDGVFLLDDL